MGNTIRPVYENFAEYPDADPKVGKEITISPSVMTGNTDTRYYWGLTENIYRFTPIRQAKKFNAHAVDERVFLDAHGEGVVFFYELLGVLMAMMETEKIEYRNLLYRRSFYLNSFTTRKSTKTEQRIVIVKFSI